MTRLRKYTVLPGQFLITSGPSLISTVLGSCVSVCLIAKDTMTGGLNHFLLPGNESDEQGNASRGLTSTPLLIRSMLNRNVKVESLEAKIFGGCNSLYRSNDIFKIGERNIAVAIEVLKSFDIPVVAKHVGGSYGRKIVFNTSTGKVHVRLLPQTAAEINEEIYKGIGH